MPKPSKKQQQTAVTDEKKLPAVQTKPGRGFEEADVEAFAIPFIAVLQKTTPWADPDDEAYIQGARPGQFINTVTLEIYDEIEVIPCAFQRRFNRWQPRALGGGFKGTFLPSAIAGLSTAKEIKLDAEGIRYYFPQPDGSIDDKKCDVLTDTRMHFCTMDGKPVLVSLSRTQLKKSKQWMTLMQTRGGDMWSTAYLCKTKKEENDQGTWQGWVITADRATTPEEQAAGEALWSSVTAGKVQVKMEQEKTVASEE